MQVDAEDLFVKIADLTAERFQPLTRSLEEHAVATGRVEKRCVGVVAECPSNEMFSYGWWRKERSSGLPQLCTVAGKKFHKSTVSLRTDIRMPPRRTIEGMTDDALENAASPNCPQCLVPMVLRGEGEAVRWECPECGLVQLA